MIPADPIFSTVVTIANGAAVSSAAEANGFGLVGIATPAALTSTTAGLELSFNEGATWLPVRNSLGQSVSIALGTSRYIALSIADMPGLPGLIRLTTGSNEAAGRSITLFLRQLN
jgi:hypothetical protein